MLIKFIFIYICINIKTNNMKIDIRSKDSLYIELNDYVYYIDDSTNEQIIDKWHTYHKPN